MFRSLRLLLLVLLLVAAPAPLLAKQERILDFHSLVQVHKDASITITETITVQALGHEIKRGIFRWLPTRQTDGAGLSKNVRFEIMSVQRDGAPEPYHIEDQGDKEVLYIGQIGVFLDPGIYTYTITYRSWRQIRYFDTYDELYWNATGNYWEFPIDKASCTVELPPGGTVVQHAGYTGKAGEQGQAFQYSTNQAGNPVFSTTRPLLPGQGLTVAVAWPKGLVYEPDDTQKLRSLLRDNMAFVVAFAGLVLVLLYYLYVWFKVGRDPQRWTIVPLYEPPQNLSPAATRYIMRMGYDNKAFAAALINLAVKGHLEMEENSGLISTTYTLYRRQNSAAPPSKGEQALLGVLFASGDSVELKQKNHKTIRKALQKLEKVLKKEYEKVYFLTNSGYLVPGLALSLGTLVLAALTLHGEARMTALFMTVWLTGWTVGCLFLSLRVVTAWKGGRTARFIGALLFALPFIAGEVFGLYLYASVVSWFTAATLLALIVLSGLFYHLLKAPTFAGRRLMDEIEGFKLFLGVAEKERLEILHSVERTPELFEKYLPYALALDVENSWSEQFADVLQAAGTDGRGYSPGWYHGSSWSNLGAAGFAGSLGSSLAGAVGSASSSGSGGGGASGGGGGGGGGGGW